LTNLRSMNLLASIALWGVKMNPKSLVALLCSTTVAACGGGGSRPGPVPPPVGGTPAPTPTPTPAPTPTPTPAPTPTPTPTPAPTPAPTPTPTPTPPPPTGGNPSLLDLQNSESFANDTASGSASFPRSGGNPTTTAAAGTGTIVYDASTRGYTLTAQGRSLAFLPSDIDASQTTNAIVVYKKVNGTTVDTLTLTCPGTSGRFTYTYVGGAFWQRTTETATRIDGQFDAMAYGVRTPASAVPRTGTGEYSVDLIGVESLSNNVVGVTGQGTLRVDFATGAVVTTGAMTAPISGPTNFSSEARLASNANSFTGTFRYWDFGEFTGTINGAFYGPAAQEVGAAYSARQGDGRAAVGLIIGRSRTPSTGNATLTNLTVNEFFSNDAARLSTTLTGQSGSNVSSGTFSNSAAGPNALVVSYSAEQGGYSLLAPERSQYFGPQSPGQPPQLNRSAGFVSEMLSFPAPETRFVTNGQLLQNLQYVRAGRWAVSQGSGSSTTYSFNDFAYGIRTPDAAVPRSGSGGFVIGVRGTAADADFPNLIFPQPTAAAA
jgi:hypothetical protein